MTALSRYLANKMQVSEEHFSSDAILQLFVFSPAITFLKFHKWNYNFLTRYMPWSKLDKIHTKWIHLYPKLKYVTKLCFLCLESTWCLFLTIPETQQTLEHKTMFYWRCEAHPFASSVKKICKDISPSKIYESHVIRQLFWDWLKAYACVMHASVRGWVSTVT